MKPIAAIRAWRARYLPRCRSGAVASVWYQLKASAASRIAAPLQAQGALEATIDLYRVGRSTGQPAACALTGHVVLRAMLSAAGEQVIRVGALPGSQLAGRDLQACSRRRSHGPARRWRACAARAMRSSRPGPDAAAVTCSRCCPPSTVSACSAST